MIKLAISGCQGRMGQRILSLARDDNAFHITTLLEHKDHPKANEEINGIKISTNNTALNGSDVLIEFTLPEGTLENLHSAVERGVKMVIGTTGLSAAQIKEIEKASEKIAIVFASNMSVGVNLLFKLTEMAASKTQDKYTMNITEAHHVHKKDAPSGTAKTLGEIAESAAGQKVQNIESIREGEMIGDHEIIFESGEDIIKISHHAKNRDIFAKGALIAAKFLIDKDTGLYSMQDVLGLKN